MEPDHWDATHKEFCYEIMEAEAVNRRLRERAEDITRFVCGDLGIDMPAIIWIRPLAVAAAYEVRKKWIQSGPTFPSKEPVIRRPHNITAGYTPNERPNEIWLLADLPEIPGWEWMIAHEIRHVYQKLRLDGVFQEESRAEGDAYPYGFDVLKSYFESKGEWTRLLAEEIQRQREAKRLLYSNRWPNGLFAVIGPS